MCVKNVYVVRLTGEFLSASVFMSILTNFSEEHPTCYYLSRCKRIKGIRTETKGDDKELMFKNRTRFWSERFSIAAYRCSGLRLLESAPCTTYLSWSAVSTPRSLGPSTGGGTLFSQTTDLRTK